VVVSGRRKAVIRTRRAACLVALVSTGALAGCGDGGSTAERNAATPGAGGEPIASSRGLQACIKAWGGAGTVVERPGAGFSDLPAHDTFDVAYPNGTTFSVAVQTTRGAAQRLQVETQGVLVATKLVNESVSDEAPAEMKDAAAATVHRVGNVVILYRNPRQSDDAGVLQCLTKAS
jgi:hypothetical protein